MNVRRILDIYVAPDCVACETARNLASLLRSLGWPDLEIRLQDLSSPGVVRPESVFAVPTYVLNGRVISLGNPEQEWLLAQLAPSPPHQEPSNANDIRHSAKAR